jgi:hypothetical protein
LRRVVRQGNSGRELRKVEGHDLNPRRLPPPLTVRVGRYASLARDREESAMAWIWRYLDESGAEVPPAEVSGGGDGSGFLTQSDAESWLGERWRALAEAGADAVVLLEDGREVYGPMSLHPPD